MFYINGYSNGEMALTAGTATLNMTLGFPGVYAITAQYNGDSENLGSTSAGINQAVTGSTIIEVSGQTSVISHSVNVTATIP
jgi:hypothetical protein